MDLLRPYGPARREAGLRGKLPRPDGPDRRKKDQTLIKLEGKDRKLTCGSYHELVGYGHKTINNLSNFQLS